MKASQIANAINALERAGHMLRCGNGSIPEQMALGEKCYECANVLMREIEKLEVIVEMQT